MKTPNLSALSKQDTKISARIFHETRSQYQDFDPTYVESPYFAFIKALLNGDTGQKKDKKKG